MANKTQNYERDPRKQFSKKLAGRTEWFWFFYLVLLVALIAYRPEVSISVVYLAILVSVVMTVSVLAYTENSRYEKGLWAAQEMAKIKFSWKHKGTEMVSTDNVVEVSDDSSDDSDNDAEDLTEEEGDNG